MSQETVNKKIRCDGKVVRIAGWVIGGTILALLFALLFGLAVQYLWNWLMPTIFSLPQISFWQAVGVIILSKILFSGFGGGHKDHESKFHMRFKKDWKKEWEKEWKKEWNKQQEEFTNEDKTQTKKFDREI